MEMTDEQIFSLVKEHFEDAFVKFAKEIRKQTIDEILTALKEVPNPDANRTAINRIIGI